MSKKSRWIVAVFGCLVALAIWGQLVHIPAPQVEAKPRPVIAFSDIEKRMDAMTTAQWDQYRAGIKGATVTGSGYVRDVKRTRDGYRVAIGTLPPVLSVLFSGVFLEGVPRSEALRLNVADRVEYACTVKDSSNILERLVVTGRGGRIQKGTQDE
jgi:hypothetical protein